MIKKLNSILTNRDKRNFFFLILFSIFVSIIEVVGISVIMPFISVAMNFKIIHTNQYFAFFYQLFQFSSDIHFVIIFGILLIFFYIFRSALNIFYTYAMAKFSQGRYYHIVFNLFKNYMGMPYKDFIKKNSSYLTKTIVTEANILAALISSALLMMSEIFVVLLIYSLMLYVNYKITLILTLFLLLNAFLMIKTISKKIKNHGKLRASMQKSFYEVINKSFGNFKLIKLHANSKIVLDEFSDASSAYAKTNITAQTLLQVPKLLLEALSFSLIILIILYMIWKYENNISTILSMLSMFVLALYRLMPSVNRIMNSYNQILFAYKSLDIVYTELSLSSEKLGNQQIIFNKEILIKNVQFEYDYNKPILQDINLTIQKGSKIAFIGESGSGKSTLVDIIIGLYKPNHGLIEVDGIPLCEKNIKIWRSKIGYIPQSVYLFDGSVAENIIFGNSYQKERIIQCLKKAKIYDFLQTKDGLNTLVGEGGIMLSGGQKQRIAIARALYTDPEVLILDEATSALDNDTEMQIMDEIYELSHDKTLIIIAHRLSTIQKCDITYKLVNGVIINV